MQVMFSDHYVQNEKFEKNLIHKLRKKQNIMESWKYLEQNVYHLSTYQDFWGIAKAVYIRKLESLNINEWDKAEESGRKEIMKYKIKETENKVERINKVMGVSLKE